MQKIFTLLNPANRYNLELHWHHDLFSYIVKYGGAHEEVDQFKYLGSVIAANGGVGADVSHRVNEGCKVLGALKGVMKNRGLGMNVNKVLYEKVVVCADSNVWLRVMEYDSN